MSYTIVTDSCSNLPESIIDEYDLVVLPMVFMVDGKEYTSYLKGEVTDLKQFYTMMREGKVITTSLPNQMEARKTIASLLEAGSAVLYLGFSSALSSTYEAIKILCDDLANDYPERTLMTVDTLAASMGEGLMVVKAAERKNQGASIEELHDWVQNNRLNYCHWFTVDDLMYLYRGGRVSKTSAYAANILSIKPILHVDNEGALIPMEKVRTRKKSIKALVDHMAQTAFEPVKDQIIYISHGDCLEDAEYLRDLIKERFGCERFLINYIDPVVGAHSGPGTLALFFEGNPR